MGGQSGDFPTTNLIYRSSQKPELLQIHPLWGIIRCFNYEISGNINNYMFPLDFFFYGLYFQIIIINKKIFLTQN